MKLLNSKIKTPSQRRNGREQTRDNPRAAGRPSFKVDAGTTSIYLSGGARTLYNTLPALLGEKKSSLLENAMREYAQSRGIDIEKIYQQAESEYSTL